MKILIYKNNGKVYVLCLLNEAAPQARFFHTTNEMYFESAAQRRKNTIPVCLFQ